MSKKIKLYEEHFPPYLEGGQISIYLNNQLLEEVIIPSPDLSAEKMSDSTNFEVEEFEDEDGNTFQCEIFSSYYEVIWLHFLGL